MAIPQIIHYVWLGKNEKPKLIQKCLKSWKRIFTDYEIIEWNETNIDLNSNEYLKQCYESKKYAFASDVIRLQVLQEYGGIYLDTDVMAEKPFTEDMLNLDFFIGFELGCTIGTAVIGSCKDNAIVKDLLNTYLNLYEPIVNNGVFINYFLNNIKGFKQINKYQYFSYGNFAVFPKKYFCEPSFNYGGGSYCRHLIYNSWHEISPFKYYKHQFVLFLKINKLGHFIQISYINILREFKKLKRKINKRI